MWYPGPESTSHSCRGTEPRDSTTTLGTQISSEVLITTYILKGVQTGALFYLFQIFAALGDTVGGREHQESLLGVEAGSCVHACVRCVGEGEQRQRKGWSGCVFIHHKWDEDPAQSCLGGCSASSMGISGISVFECVNE